jgi:hypothetical protein
VAISLYDASIPHYARMLKNLAALLDKGEIFAADKGLSLDDLARTKLAPDMGDLIRQVQFASDAAKSGAARLAGLDVPSFPDTETTFGELKERIGKTIAFVESVKRELVDGQEAREIVLKFPGRTMTFKADAFLLDFSMPNFLFHVTTAYDVLRHAGVPLQKMDYLMGSRVTVTMDPPTP